MTRGTRYGLGLAVLLWATGVQATTTAQQKCEMAKLRAGGNLQACLKRQAAKVVIGRVDASADCRTRFSEKLVKVDAKAAAAVPPASCRYIDNADGTVSDLNTGLVWDQKTTTVGSGVNPADPNDVDNYHEWSIAAPAADGPAFTSFVATLNGGTSTDGIAVTTPCFAGHCDWRLPTVQELTGIVDLTVSGCGTVNPCIHATFGPTQANGYWASTTDGADSSNAWYVDFTDGTKNVLIKTVPLYVRAVRGGY